MKLVADLRGMQRMAEDLRREGRRISVVPTMGFLHEGHLSLIRIARQNSDTVITTIFVNPTQFSPTEDFESYPRDLERDKRLAESAGSDLLFVPAPDEMYPKEYLTFVTVEKITDVLEGKVRPSHFRGVVTVVAKLINLTKPHVAVFGQKDAQQAAVVTRMIGDLNFDCEVIVAPTVREPDGLAMSSRNVYLSPEDRLRSAVLFRSLTLAGELVKNGERNSAEIISAMRKLIATQASARIDYISVADRLTLEELPLLTPGEALVSLAVRFGTTRLIDNIIVRVP
jgi:pantoate--beta-alanine ligase